MVHVDATRLLHTGLLVGMERGSIIDMLHATGAIEISPIDWDDRIMRSWPSLSHREQILLRWFALPWGEQFNKLSQLGKELGVSISDLCLQRNAAMAKLRNIAGVRDTDVVRFFYESPSG